MVLAWLVSKCRARVVTLGGGVCDNSSGPNQQHVPDWVQTYSQRLFGLFLTVYLKSGFVELEKCCAGVCGQ